MCRSDERRLPADKKRISGCSRQSVVSSRRSIAGTLVLLALFTTACSQNGSLQIMANQPRYDPLSPSNFFPNGMSAQPVISDTVAFRQAMTDTLLYNGTTKGARATTFPFPITREVMLRGQERYNIYCTPCHGVIGDGQGIIAQRGFCCPASFHTDTLRNAPVGHFFDVITNGFGRMPSYASQIAARDRWAIIAYVRALQLSQNATLDDVPPEERNQLGSATPAP